MKPFNVISSGADNASVASTSPLAPVERRGRIGSPALASHMETSLKNSTVKIHNETSSPAARTNTLSQLFGVENHGERSDRFKALPRVDTGGARRKKPPAPQLPGQQKRNQAQGRARSGKWNNPPAPQLPGQQKRNQAQARARSGKWNKPPAPQPPGQLAVRSAHNVDRPQDSPGVKANWEGLLHNPDLAQQICQYLDPSAAFSLLSLFEPHEHPFQYILNVIKQLSVYGFDKENLNAFHEYMTSSLQSRSPIPHIAEASPRDFWKGVTVVRKKEMQLATLPGVGYGTLSTFEGYGRNGYWLLKQAIKSKNMYAAVKIIRTVMALRADESVNDADLRTPSGKALLQDEFFQEQATREWRELIMLAAGDLPIKGTGRNSSSLLQILCDARPTRLELFLRAGLGLGGDPNSTTPVHDEKERSDLPLRYCSPLAILAASSGHPVSGLPDEELRACMELLVKAGADLDDAGHGHSPLDIACLVADDDVGIKVLLELGANPRKKNGGSLAPLDILLLNQKSPANTKKLKTLLAHLSDGSVKADFPVLSSSQIGLAAGKQPSELNMLCEHFDIDLNFCNSRNEFSPLLWAAHDYMMHVELKHSREKTDEALSVVRALISRGAKIRYWHKGKVKDYKYDLAGYITKHCNARWHQPSDELRPLSQLFQEYGPEQPV